MSLQDLFYAVSIVFMLSILVIFVAGGLIAYKLQKKVSKIKKMADHPADTAAEFGAGIVEGISSKVQEMLRSTQKTSRKRK